MPKGHEGSGCRWLQPGGGPGKDQESSPRGCDRSSLSPVNHISNEPNVPISREQTPTTCELCKLKTSAEGHGAVLGRGDVSAARARQLGL